jgi:hypothetical protein
MPAETIFVVSFVVAAFAVFTVALTFASLTYDR